MPLDNAGTGSARASAQQSGRSGTQSASTKTAGAKAKPGPAGLNPTFDPLEAFLAWFLKQGSPIGWVTLHGAVRYIDGVTAVLWYRKGEFQIQQFIVPPDHIIPEHTHPNVDSFEVYVGGQIRFSKAGRFIIAEEDLSVPNEHGWAKNRGKIIRVRPNDLHGGVFGPSGGVFFSVQRWLNGVKPHCVSADYNGVVMGPEHKAGVVFGDAQLKTRLSATDAASQEPSGA
jgi:hypothetical protein